MNKKRPDQESFCQKAVLYSGRFLFFIFSSYLLSSYSLLLISRVWFSLFDSRNKVNTPCLNPLDSPQGLGLPHKRQGWYER